MTRRTPLVCGLVLCFGLMFAGPVACDEETALAERAKIVQKYNDAVASQDTELANFYSQKLAEADAKIAGVKSDPTLNYGKQVLESDLVNLIPEPIRSPFVWIGSTIWFLLGRFKWKNAATSIAKSIEKLPETTVWSSDAVSTTLDANQSPAAKAAVDLAQGKKVSLMTHLL